LGRRVVHKGEKSPFPAAGKTELKGTLGELKKDRNFFEGESLRTSQRFEKEKGPSGRKGKEKGKRDFLKD